MVYLFPTKYVSMLILLFPDSVELSLEDALHSGKSRSTVWHHVVYTLIFF